MKKSLTAIVLIFLVSTVSFSQTTDTGMPEPVPRAQEKKSQDFPPGFKSDSCTWFPDGNYGDCCVAHDIDYYKGGSLKQRRRSDMRLYRCVKKKNGWRNKIIAPLMYIGVRIGGVSFLPTPFRWGFGRKKIRRALRKAEAEKKKGMKLTEKSKEKTTKTEDRDDNGQN
jgi:hypothetical protein